MLQEWSWAASSLGTLVTAPVWDLNSVLCLLQVFALCGTGDHNNE